MRRTGKEAATTAHKRKEKAAQARVEEVIDKDPTDEIVYTNLKH